MKHLTALLLCAALTVCPALADSDEPAQGQLLSAFFGLDDSPRIRVRTSVACRGIPGGDGMPVIFAHEVDSATLEPEDFQVTRASGEIGRVDCVTLRPADDPGELRTALVIGQYGSVEDPPVTVEIVGDVMSLDGDLNFRGATAEVIPLAAGPNLILAESVPPNYWSLGGPGDCPRDGLKAVVRAVWVGGITRPGGDEIGAAEMGLYRVSLRQPDGTVVAVAPMAVGDLNDNDNNHELCLDVEGEPLSVFFPAGAVTDPNEDLNPDTEIDVSAFVSN